MPRTFRVSTTHWTPPRSGSLRSSDGRECNERRSSEMPLRVRDVHQLHNQLVDRGSRAQLDDGQLAELTTWLEQVGFPDRILDRQTFGALYECGRRESDQTVRQLANGLLSWLPEASASWPELALFATCFV